MPKELTIEIYMIKFVLKISGQLFPVLCFFEKWYKLTINSFPCKVYSIKFLSTRGFPAIRNVFIYLYECVFISLRNLRRDPGQENEMNYIHKSKHPAKRYFKILYNIDTKDVHQLIKSNYAMIMRTINRRQNCADLRSIVI